MGTFPLPPTFPVDVSADPGSGIVVTRQGTAFKFSLDPAGIGSSSPGTVSAIAASACDAHRALRSDPGGGVREYSAVDPSQFGTYVGISLMFADAGQPIAYRQSGPIDDPSWTWTAGLPVYAGVDGILTQDEPSAGVAQAVGVAASPTRISIDRSPPVLL